MVLLYSSYKMGSKVAAYLANLVIVDCEDG